MSARRSLAWAYSCCRLFGFPARHTSLPVTLPSCYSPPPHTWQHGPPGLAWTRLTADTSGMEATKRELKYPLYDNIQAVRRNKGLGLPFPGSYLNISRTWLPRLVGHCSFLMSWFQERLTMLVRSAPLRSRARQVDSVASPCVTPTSALPKPPPTARPAPEDGKSA